MNTRLDTPRRFDPQTFDAAVLRAHALREQAITDAWQALVRGLRGQWAAATSGARRRNPVQWG